MATTQRLLPSVVDDLAQSDPHRVLYSIPKTKTVSEGFQDIDAVTFARAVDRCAWYLHDKLGTGEGFPTVTYMGPQDLVYPILILACIKTSYKLLLNSPRNTVEAHLSLFEKTDCETFLLPPNFPLPAVKHILAAKQMRVVDIPGVQYWLEGGPVKRYPYSKTFTDAKSEPFVVLHTSGSTGMPKPIIQTHGTQSPLEAFTKLPSIGRQDTYPAMCRGKRVYLAFPLFHCAGVSMVLPACLYAQFTVVLGPFPPSADVTNDVHVYGNVQHSCLAPMTLIELVKNPEYLENLGRLEQVTFGGGSLPQAVGDLIATKTKLLNCLGTTECGVLPIQLCDLEDWAYISVSTVLGHEYRHVSEDLYEQVIVRQPALESYQGIFATFPDLSEWSMKDLYTKHPSKSNIWMYKGRTDDILVFTTGEKLNPLEMEALIDTNPVINAALITGFGKCQSSLLVEAVKPPSNDSERKSLLNLIWPSVVAANKISPSHGRIHRDMILFTSPEKPMPKAGKGTVQRKPAVDLYTAELDLLYKDTEVHLNGSLNGTGGSYSDANDVVKQIITNSMDIGPFPLDSTADLFGLGLDSLQVIAITKDINKYLAQQGKSPSMQAKWVYANPSVIAIAAVVTAILEGQSLPANEEHNNESAERLLKTFAAELPLSERSALSNSTSDLAVLLTGSTGSLGSYILDALIADSRVSYIYCLNRGPGGLERLEICMKSRNLRGLQTKVKCYDADISKPYFGLPTQDYRSLLSKVTTIIHNAWQVDFNMPIDSFQIYIGTVRRFIDFSAHSKFGANLFFVSSISAVANGHAVTGNAESIAEKVFEDWKISSTTGYGLSKLVAERLLDVAAKDAHIPATICRIGQIAGPTKAAGMWPQQEWLPSLIKSSKYLRKIPASLGPLEVIDWIPVDLLAQGIIELATYHMDSKYPGPTVFHAVNPQQTSWGSLLPTVKWYLDSSGEVQTVSLEVWVNALRESTSKVEDVESNPAVKILGFFEDLVGKNAQERIILETENAVSISNTLAGLESIKETWVANWMHQWAL